MTTEKTPEIEPPRNGVEQFLFKSVTLFAQEKGLPKLIADSIALEALDQFRKGVLARASKVMEWAIIRVRDTAKAYGASPEKKTLKKTDIISAMESAMLLRAVVEHKPRPYIGMSSVGHSCALKSWLSFRWASGCMNSADSLLNIQDGFASERLTMERLRMAGVDLRPAPEELATLSAERGLIQGHLDGIFYEDGKPASVWEHKCVSHLEFNRFQRMRIKHGDGRALAMFSSVYFVQAQLYMNAAKIPEHTLTVAVAGSREYASVKTAFSKGLASREMLRARDILAAPTAPPRLHSKARHPCTMCEHEHICHDGFLPAVNCRTCLYWRAVDGAVSHCAKHNKALNLERQANGCADHLYNPEVIATSATQYDAEPQRHTVYYERKNNGKLFANGAARGAMDSETLCISFKAEQ